MIINENFLKDKYNKDEVAFLISMFEELNLFYFIVIFLANREQFDFQI